MADSSGTDGDLAELPLTELMARSQALATELSSRLSDPRLVEALPQVRSAAEDHDHPEAWGLYAHVDRPDAEAAADPADTEATVPVSGTVRAREPRQRPDRCFGCGRRGDTA